MAIVVRSSREQIMGQVIVSRFIEEIASPPNRWMEPTVKSVTPLQEVEQWQCHFCLRLIQDVRRQGR